MKGDRDKGAGAIELLQELHQIHDGRLNPPMMA